MNTLGGYSGWYSGDTRACKDDPLIGITVPVAQADQLCGSDYNKSPLLAFLQLRYDGWPI